MISLSPDTITYTGVSSSNVNGETSEVDTPVSGIGCSVQPSSKNRYLIGENGDNIIYSYCVIITDPVEIAKLPAYNKNDKVVYNSNSYKVLSFEDYQKHVEIYV